ncbi:MAG: NAD(+) diphosphatase [Lacisediminihabitans sp.]
MSGSFHPELPLSRSEHDRDYLLRRRPHLFEELAIEDSARVLVLWNGKALVKGADLDLLPSDRVPKADLRIYLGRSLSKSSPEAVGTPVLAAVVSDEVAAQLSPDPATWASLRDLGSALSRRDAGLFTEALAMANWHQSHGFSPRTGEPTVPELGGWVRRSPASEDAPGHENFPRTDAAIIVGITDADDRLLLGSNALWEENRFSLLAGFVEPGESLESAVLREVYEESGIRLIDPVYVGSQPWPFPASLMVGFRAKVDPNQDWTLTPDGDEILELRWFSRDELTAALGSIILPGHTSIARFIIEDWFGGPIEDGQPW